MDKDFLIEMGITDENADLIIQKNNEAINEINLKHSLEAELSKRGVKSLKAAMRLIDTSGVSFEEGEIFGIEECVDTFCSENAFLFEEKSKPPVFSKSVSGSKSETITKDNFFKMGYQKRLKLFNENPELYEQLKN